MHLIYSFVFFQLIFLSHSYAFHHSLNGNDWVATNQNGSIEVSAKVPGSIYSDLMRNGVIGDPFYRYNDFAYRWVGYDNWTFVKNFSVDEKLLNSKSAQLVLDGVDTVSHVYVNDKLVGTTDNQFVRYVFDVKNVLKLDNTIKVAFESAVSYAFRKQAEHLKTRGYPVPPDCPAKEQRGICHVNFIRKMQAAFSWDWGPALPTQGIWKNISVVGLENALIRDVSVETVFNKTWFIKTKVHIETATADSFDGILFYYLDGNKLFEKESVLKPNSDKTIQIDQEFKVNDTIKVKSWWPNGVGLNEQNLYKFQVVLVVRKNDTNNSVHVQIPSKNYKIGFRTIELIQEPVKPKGLTFNFRVNGLDFFAKGSNWIPAHVFYEQLDEKYIRSLFKAAKDANMNMMRVWGGGIYETDYFYELADEFGIMIWQDMMFACGLYPTDDNFIKSVTAEITQNIRRLQHHPSIAMWAGNNENEWAISQPWYPQVKLRKQTYRKEYVQLYINVIKKIIDSEDNSRGFSGSSPSNGLETEQEGWIAKNPGDRLYGDTHYYNYGSKPLNWKQYPTSRFGSEYGLESYPSVQTLASVTNQSDLVYPIDNKSLFEHRQHHPAGRVQIRKMVETYFDTPAPGGVERFNDFVYLTQIIQAMAMKIETEFYRTNRAVDSKTGLGYTMGALYWQLNDIWQAPTWASIEFTGKWKMLQYFAKKMFDNLLVSAHDENDQLKVYIVRDDLLKEVTFTVSIHVMKWSSFSRPFSKYQNVSTPSGLTATLVPNENITHLLSSAKCQSRFDCFIYVEIQNKTLGLYADNFWFLEHALKNATGLTKANLKVAEVTQVTKVVNSNETTFKIKLQADSVAPYVWLDFNYKANINGTFSDNGFLMLNQTKEVTFTSEDHLTVNDVKSNLVIKSVKDVTK